MKNEALTPEQARELTYPRLMEVWDSKRTENKAVYVVVTEFSDNCFISTFGVKWLNAAEPPAEIAEAMRAQFAWQPQRMLVWDIDEAEAVERIVIADLGEMALNGRYICVSELSEGSFSHGKYYHWSDYNHAKPLPELDPITAEIEELTKRIKELKQQIKCK